LKIVKEVIAPASATEREKVAFFDVADRLIRTTDRAEQERLKEELARKTFGSGDTVV
jgi:hypothetical protein